jgi:peptide/nickel transport system ATP-binding protein
MFPRRNRSRVTPPLLEAIALEKTFALPSGFLKPKRRLHAVRGVSCRVARGETLGLVGESGCGKSTLGRCLLRLQSVSGGNVLFDGTDITNMSEPALRPLRPRMQMIFQDSTASLNPRRRVGDLIAEPLRVHPADSGGGRGHAIIAARCEELMDLVGLRRDHLERFPHEFSGGQRQRINIARALALHPDLVVADEPVSALDVSVQAQVVNLMMDLQDKLGLTYVFVAHDLAVVRQIATRTAVMYLGAIVEIGPTARIFTRPAHPYTSALLQAVPRVSRTGAIAPLSGEVPSPLAPPRGCAFHPRCARAQARCREESPILGPPAEPWQVACHFPA